jgi:hypothetical protein
MDAAQEQYVADMLELAKSPAGLALAPLGFEPQTLGGDLTGYVLDLPGTTHRAVVTLWWCDSAPTRSDEGVLLHMQDDDGYDLHEPVRCRDVHEVVAQFRDGVWDGFGNSTLRLKSP